MADIVVTHHRLCRKSEGHVTPNFIFLNAMFDRVCGNLNEKEYDSIYTTINDLKNIIVDKLGCDLDGDVLWITRTEDIHG